LGVCLYEALTGERPYGNAPSYLSAHLGYMPATQRVAGLPPELDALISSALAPDKEDRIQTVREFYALMAALPGVASPGAGQPH
jgi:serine/threonine-protein kinase